MSFISSDPAALESIVEECLVLWNGKRIDVSAFPSRHNFVCRFLDGATGAKRILRIAYATHRSASDVVAEMEFVLHLSASGCAVAAPVVSTKSTLVESLGAERDYRAAVFEEIEGDPNLFRVEQADPLLVAKLGRWIGRAHRVSVEFQPQRAARFHWFDDEFYKSPELFLPDSEPELQNEMAELIRWLNARPATCCLGLMLLC